MVCWENGKDETCLLYTSTGLPARLLPSPCGSAEIVGTVTQWAASMTGLAAGTPVTGGTIDTVAATIGAGAVAEGDFALTIGSSGRLCSIAGQPMEDSRLLNLYGAYDGQYIIVQSTNCLLYTSRCV